LSSSRDGSRSLIPSSCISGVLSGCMAPGAAVNCAGAASCGQREDGADPGCQWRCQRDVRAPVDTRQHRPARATRIALVRRYGADWEALAGTVHRWLQNRCEQRPCSGGFDSRPPPLPAAFLSAWPLGSPVLLASWHRRWHGPARSNMCSSRLPGMPAWNAHDSTLTRPIAGSLERCAELLGVDLDAIREAAADVEPTCGSTEPRFGA
jgi:hypothetical protein